jgi:hypothetical protein
MSTQSETNQTQRQKFESLAKRVIAAPKKDVDALQKEWKKTKHKRGSTPSISWLSGA